MGTLRGSRVVVTGGSGFLGQHVCQALAAHQPSAIVVPRSAEYDLRDRMMVRRLYEEARPDIVIHLAAVVGGIAANRKNPGRFFHDNAIMGIQLMDEAVRTQVRKFVAIGTICCYPKLTPVPFREENLWDGYPEETNAPYGLAKKMLLVQAQAYRAQYGLNAITLLPVNLYGPHDNFDPETSHVIPALIRKTLEARDQRRPFVEVWGTGNASREFLFVRDAADAVVCAAADYDKPEPVNIGSGQEITIAQLVKLITKSCGYAGEVRWDSTKPDGQPRRCLDVSRAEREFGFTATTSFSEGLAETIAWYEKWRRSAAGRQAA